MPDPLYTPGQRVLIVLGCRWYPAVIVRPFEWRDGRGNVRHGYHVDIGTGVIRCLANSLFPLEPAHARK